MIEGESLFNDGTAMVVFLVLIEFVEGNSLTFMDVVIKFIRLSFGGILLGICCGVIVEAILKRIHNNFVLEVNTTIYVCYLMFFLAESTELHVSGILALVALGLFMTKSGKTRISAESEHAVHHVWGYIGFMAETLIFILSGIIMGERATADDNLIGAKDYAKLFGVYVCLHFIRFFMILAFWPCL